MSKSLFFLCVLISSISVFGQDHYEKKYSLGQHSGGKWYKLMNFDLNGNGNHNSVNISVNFHYVNTWTKYNGTAILRLRENSTNDWQHNVSGTNMPVLKFKKISAKVSELWAFSQSGWGHLSFTAVVTKEAPFIVTIADTPIESLNIDSLEDVPTKGDWYFPSGRIEIAQDDNQNEDKGLLITEKNNSQKIHLHLADNASGEYGYLSLGGQTSLRGNGKPSYFEGFVGIGTTNSSGFKLAVNGNIRAKEIKVETNWADYVFKKDYNLPTLQQVEDHIIEKGHLINIPSAAEVEKNGIQLGEMNAKLLEKIEELTLYTIEQEKRIKSLEEKLNNVLDNK
ncbi:hypothetical protein [Aquimarina sp. Aq107]|uniref:hypothetical protein n=1 Tax=Aquimarina sp. Aq107 TaxID=1191912 RepID=UPI000D55E0D7|nr:hypothetical protein [Aquimarina sp. Aq107]